MSAECQILAKTLNSSLTTSKFLILVWFKSPHFFVSKAIYGVLTESNTETTTTLYLLFEDLAPSDKVNHRVYRLIEFKAEDTDLIVQEYESTSVACIASYSGYLVYYVLGHCCSAFDVSEYHWFILVFKQ